MTLQAQVLELYRLLSRSRRRQLYGVVGLMLAGAVAELATVGSVIPFLALLSAAPGEAPLGPLSTVVARLEDIPGIDPLAAAAGLFIAVILTAGLLRLQLAWSTQRFVLGLGHDLSVELQRRILLQPYSFHIGSNPSTLLGALDKVRVVVDNVILQLMYGGAAVVLGACIIAAVIAVDPVSALISTVFFGLIYFLVSKLTHRRLASNAAVLRDAYDERLKTVQESFGGIRDVIIENAQPIYLTAFARVDRRLNEATAMTNFLASAPRLLIETLGMALIALVALAIAGRGDGIGNALPILGALALAAQRLLPLAQQVYHSWAQVAGHRYYVTQVLDFLRLPADSTNDAPAPQPLRLSDRIALDRVSFTYPSRRDPAIAEVSLDIAHGTRLGIIGKSGSGKSTLGDLIMALLEPTSGKITIDGVEPSGEARRRWHAGISHVPQTIFLADASIARNIAFSIAPEPIDIGRVIDASKKAQLHDFVESLPDGYDTRVGERGIRLSGGQRQRLGIARAIYKDAPVFVLDEATSALDHATESKIMGMLDELKRAGRTVIIISHRRSTVAGCDHIVSLADGRIAASGKVDELFGAEEVHVQRSSKLRGMTKP
ncbi:MAG TPA: ABC transporter ATP-binding protein [Sphingomicrobium sp.]|nr:ABC transporter ATP-binding protein [Sphingomicrobium sp.]